MINARKDHVRHVVRIWQLETVKLSSTMSGASRKRAAAHKKELIQENSSEVTSDQISQATSAFDAFSAAGVADLLHNAQDMETAPGKKRKTAIAIRQESPVGIETMVDKIWNLLRAIYLVSACAAVAIVTGVANKLNSLLGKKEASKRQQLGEEVLVSLENFGAFMATPTVLGDDNRQVAINGAIIATLPHSDARLNESYERLTGFSRRQVEQGQKSRDNVRDAASSPGGIFDNTKIVKRDASHWQMLEHGYQYIIKRCNPGNRGAGQSSRKVRP